MYLCEVSTAFAEEDLSMKMIEQRTGYGASELGDWNSKGSCRRKYPVFSERLKAIHPASKVLRRSFPVNRLADESQIKFLLSLKCVYVSLPPRLSVTTHMK